MNHNTNRDDITVDLFQRALRVSSTSHMGPSSGSYESMVALLREAAIQRGFETSVHYNVPNKPILLCTLRGTQPNLQSLLLNSHYDVVPAENDKWTMGDPWAANITHDGWIVGRGTQDMKCVCVMHLEALYRASQMGALQRTVHITMVPDEEIGGKDGLGMFVESDTFKKLNVGCALDEGLANPNPGEITVFYGERAIFWMRLHAAGNVGHGSRFIKDQAIMKINRVVNKFMEFRAIQEAKYEGHDGCKHGVAHKLGDVTTVNCTMLSGGVTSDNGKTYALNCIPGTAEAGFDLRIPPTMDLDEMYRMVKGWCDPDGIEIEFVQRVEKHAVSSIDPEKSHWWATLRTSLEHEKLKVVPEIFPAGTDSRYLREIGIPAFGVSPMDGTPILLHDHNERLHVDVFKRGIATMTHVVRQMANDVQGE